MKKLFFLIITSFSLISCTNDATENSNDNKSILPKILKVYNQDNSLSYITTITYDGNKIVSVTSNAEKINYFYDEDKIVKELKYRFEKDKEILYSETSFTYVNDNLHIVDNVTYGRENKSVYVYKEDGTIEKETYEINDKTGKESKNDANEILTFVNGNLTQRVVTYDSDSRTLCNTNSYEYDTSKNAFKNVLGFNLLLDQVIFALESNPCSKNNVKKTSSVSLYDLGSEYLINASYIKFDYNKNCYPIKKTIHSFEGEDEIIEYRY